MPNLRDKTWTATTPAQTVDANFWENHLIDDESYDALQDLIEDGASAIGVINVDNVITNNVQTSLANVYNIAKRTEKNITLSVSNWANGTYTISDTDITASNIVSLTYPVTITDGDYSILQAAAIRATGQAAGSLTLKATGTVPTTDITITLVIQGA